MGLDWTCVSNAKETALDFAAKHLCFVLFLGHGTQGRQQAESRTPS